MAENRAWLKWLGIGCGAILLLIVGFVVVTFLVVRSATSGPEDVARKFLTAAGAGDYAGAHDMFSAPLKDKQPLAEFTAAARANPSLFKVKDLSFSERSVDLSGAKLAGTATLESGTEVPISFSFVKENEAWKLLGYHIGSTE